MVVLGDMFYELARSEKPFCSEEEIEEEADRARDFVSQYDSLGDLWYDLDQRGHQDENFKISDIYEYRPLDCQGRANAVVLYDKMNPGEHDVELRLQYDPESFLWIDFMTNGHVTPVVDGESIDDLSGRSCFEPVDVDQVPNLQTLGMGYETFEKANGANLPNDYLKGEAERILREQDEKPFDEKSEAIRRQANAMKISAQLDSLLGPFSGVLRQI